MGVSDGEKINTAIDIAREWEISIVRPDPREWSYNHAIANKGLTVHELFSFDGPDEKGKYLYTFKRFVERHTLHIPCAFEEFIRCLKQMSFGENGRVIKKRYHNFDSGLYGISYYGELQDDDNWWKDIKGKPQEEKVEEKPNDNVERINDTTTITHDFEKEAKKEKYGDEKSNPEDEGMDFPWGEGISGY
jgi:hypothetical protein